MDYDFREGDKVLYMNEAWTITEIDNGLRFACLGSKGWKAFHEIQHRFHPGDKVLHIKCPGKVFTYCSQVDFSALSPNGKSFAAIMGESGPDLARLEALRPVRETLRRNPAEKRVLYTNASKTETVVATTDPDYRRRNAPTLPNLRQFGGFVIDVAEVELVTVRYEETYFRTKSGKEFVVTGDEGAKAWDWWVNRAKAD